MFDKPDMIYARRVIYCNENDKESDGSMNQEGPLVVCGEVLLSFVVRFTLIILV